MPNVKLPFVLEKENEKRKENQLALLSLPKAKETAAQSGSSSKSTVNNTNKSNTVKGSTTVKKYNLPAKNTKELPGKIQKISNSLPGKKYNLPSKNAKEIPGKIQKISNSLPGAARSTNMKNYTGNIDAKWKNWGNKKSWPKLGEETGKKSVKKGLENMPESLSSGVKAIKNFSAATGTSLKAGLKNWRDSILSTIALYAKAQDLYVSGEDALAGALDKNVRKYNEKMVQGAPEGIKTVIKNTAKMQKESQEKLSEDMKKYNLSPGAEATANALGYGVGNLLPTALSGAVGMDSLSLFHVVFANSLAEAVNEGASEEEAFYYATFNGLKEAAIEKMMGGIPGLKGVGDEAIERAVGKIFSNKGVQSFVISAINAGGEGIEEDVSLFLQTYIKRAVYNPDAPIPTAEELGSAFLGGAAISGIMNVPGALVNGIGSRLGKKYNIPTAGAFKEQNGNFDLLPKAGEFKQDNKIEGVMQPSDVTSPEVTSKTQHTYTPSTDNISQTENIVNSNGMQNRGNRITLTDNVPNHLKNAVNTITNRTGIDVKFGTAYHPDGSVNNQFRGFYGYNTIVISENATRQDLFRSVAIHEMTHSIEGTKYYSDIESYVVNKLYNGDKTQLDNAIAKKIEYYRQNNVTLDESGAKAEIIAENAGELIFADDVQSIVEQDYTLGQKIYDLITDLIYRMQKKLDVKDLDELRNAQRKYRMALESVRKNGTQKASGQYDIYNMGDHKRVVVTNDITREQEIDKPSKLKEYIKRNFDEIKVNLPNGINGVTYVTERGAGEYAYSSYTKRLSGKTLYDKYRMADNIDEIIKSQVEYQYEDPNHRRTDNIIGFYRSPIEIQVGNRLYDCELVTGITRDGKEEFYDVVNMNLKNKNEPYPTLANRISVKGRRDSDSSIDMVPQKEPSVNTNNMQKGKNNTQGQYSFVTEQDSETGKFTDASGNESVDNVKEAFERLSGVNVDADTRENLNILKSLTEKYGEADYEAEFYNVMKDEGLKVGDEFDTGQLRRNFEKEVDDIINVDDDMARKNADNRVAIEIMGETPSVVLDNVKYSQNLPIIMNYTKMYLAVRKDGVIKGNYHNLGSDLVKKLPEYLSNPDAIIRLKNGRLNFLTQIQTEKGNNGILSLELNSTKDIEGENKNYNVIVTLFSGDDNYVENLVSQDGISVEYKKEDLPQVNPQLYNWLATINGSSSNNNVPQNEGGVKGEEINRIKDLNGRRARTPDESRELVNLLYNQFGKDTPEFADVRNDIASPIYSNKSNETISHTVNNLIANENRLYELKKEAGKIKKALEPNAKQMEYIEKIARGEADFDDFSPSLGLDKFQGLIKALEDVYAVENNGIKNFKERTRLDFKDTVEDFIKNSEEWKDKLTEFQWEINTPERNAYDTMGEDAEKFIETFITPMKQNEAQKIRYINEHKQTIKDLKLTPEEFEQTMRYGEGIIRNASPKIQNAAKVFNEIAEEIKNDVNATLVLNGYKPIDNPKINLNANEFRDALTVLTGEKQYEQMLSDKIRQFINIAERYGIDSIQYDSKGKVTASVNIPYFPHGEVLDNLQQVKKAMGFSLEVSELPGEITGRTEDFNPNKKWVGNIDEKRKSNKTSYTIALWDNYINNISDVIYHTSDITKLRLLENGLRSKYSQSRIDEEVSIARNLMTNEELDKFFEELDERKGEITEHNHLINWLHEYANIVAGKKHSVDRAIEKLFGRGFYNLMTTAERNWAVNTVGGNVSSVLNQFSQLTSLVAEKDPADVITAIGTVFFGDGTALNESDFMTTKEGAIKLSKSGIEKVANVMFLLPTKAENITSKLVWQTAYNEAIREGKTKAQAKTAADKYATQIMADRTKMGMPTIFSSKDIVVKFLTTFQIEPANTFFHYIKDLPGEKKAKGILWLIKSALATALLNYFFNKGKEKLTGSGNVMLDPVETAIKVYQWIADEEGVEFADVLESIGENATNLPFMQTTMAIFGFDDAGQIPMTNSIPDIPEMYKNWQDGKKGKVVEEIGDTVINLFNPIGGYNQLKKGIKGVGAVMKGGEYTSSGNLSYPIEQSAGNYIRGALFGKYSLPENQDFWDNNKKAFGEEETKEYNYRVQQGENPQDVYNEIYRLKMDSAAQSDANAAYREKAEGMIKEFDYGTFLQLKNIYNTYKEENPDAASITVPSSSKKFSYKGEKYNLTEEQYADLQNRYNTAYYEGIKDIVNNSSLTEEEKYEQIAEVRKSVQETVKEEFAREELIGTQKNVTVRDIINSRSQSSSTENNSSKPTVQEIIDSRSETTNSENNRKKPTVEDIINSRQGGSTDIGFKNYNITNYNDGNHKGMDFAVPEGTAVQSTISGEVVKVLSLPNSYGKYVVIKDNSGNYHYYAHLSGFNCNVGDTVNRGSVIGYSGNTGNSTGPHLHYEVRTGNDYSNQIDPRNYL